MAKYFKYPFGVDGDRTTIPDPTQPDGSVSYDQGFGPDYQLDPDTDPEALNIPRNEFNDLIYQTQLAVQQYQQFGFPDFITSSDNGGSPFSYSKNAVVRYGGINYSSLIDANTDTPPTSNWVEVSFNTPAFRTADVIETYDSTLPSGWLWLDGKTIGSATSGGTARANVDTLNLFTSLWNSISNAVLPIQNSSGASSTRGISAAADFASNKRLPLPDRRGRVAAAADNLGGTAAGRLTGSPTGGVDGTVLANFGGEQGHALITAENAEHSHSGSSLTFSGNGNLSYNSSKLYGTTGSPPTTGGILAGSGGITVAPQLGVNITNSSPYVADLAGVSIGGSTATSGAGASHNNVQPTIIANFRIKL